MEKSIHNPQINRNVGDWLFEDSKRRERESEIIQHELDLKAKEDASWGVSTASTTDFVEWLYIDWKAMLDKEEQAWEKFKDAQCTFAPTLN